MKKGKQALKQKYNIAKKSKVGENCVCPSCQTEFVKVNHQQAFCKSKGGTVCKDFYWNNVTESKQNNTTRISPANRRNQQSFQENRDSFIDDDDPSWDAHKDSF